MGTVPDSPFLQKRKRHLPDMASLFSGDCGNLGGRLQTELCGTGPLAWLKAPIAGMNGNGLIF
jgi:hypothetical protein